MEAFIFGWTPQWYVYVPTWAKVKLNESPWAKLMEPQELSSAVTSWLTESWLVHFTVVPTLMVSETGLNAKPEIATSTLPEAGATVVSVGPPDVGATAVSEGALDVAGIMGGNVPAGVGAAFGPQAASRKPARRIKVSLVFMIFSISGGN